MMSVLSFTHSLHSFVQYLTSVAPNKKIFVHGLAALVRSPKYQDNQSVFLSNLLDVLLSQKAAQEAKVLQL